MSPSSPTVTSGRLSSLPGAQNGDRITFNAPTAHQAIGKHDNTSGSRDWRYGIGLLLLAMAGLSILFGIVAVFSGQARGESLGSPVWLLAGPAEILCLLAAAILGKEKYHKLTRKVRRSAPSSDTTWRKARLHYYLGLAGCLFNGIPLALYAYLPGMLPGGTTKMSILVIADLVFFVSLFFAGGEFWEKLRRIFVWEGGQYRTG